MTRLKGRGFSRSRLKSELRRQLNLSRDPLEGSGRTRRSDGPVRRTCRDIWYKRRAARSRSRSNRRRIIELRSVEQVEELAADLQDLRFSQLKVLEGRKIHVLCSRTLKNVAPSISPLPIGQRPGQRNA